MADTRNLEETAIRWHPAFLSQYTENAPVTRFLYGAAELGLRDNKDDLKFHREYNLSKEPLRIDRLIVWKLTDAWMKNEIGHIFRQYNIIEYKSPTAGARSPG